MRTTERSRMIDATLLLVATLFIVFSPMLNPVVLILISFTLLALWVGLRTLVSSWDYTHPIK